jgi:hypothetical protein
MNWWVVPEGVLGKFVNALSPQGPTLNLYAVKQSSGKPAGAVAGPFATQAQAQAQAAKLNQGAVATPGNIASSTGQALTNGILPENWFMRAGEIFIGLILLAVGLNTLMKGTIVGDAASSVSKAVPKVVPV